MRYLCNPRRGHLLFLKCSMGQGSQGPGRLPLYPHRQFKGRKRNASETERRDIKKKKLKSKLKPVENLLGGLLNKNKKRYKDHPFGLETAVCL